MKKFFSVLLVAAMMFTLMTACSSSTSDTGKSSGTSTTTSSSASGTSGSPDAAKSEPIVISFASFHTETELDTVRFTEPWLQAIEKACADAGYNIEFDRYWGGTLVSLPDSYQAVLDGTADMALFLTAMPGLFNLENALIFPWNGIEIKYPSLLYETLYSEFPEIQAEYSKVHVIATLVERPQKVNCNTKFTDMASSKGKIWTSTGAVSSAIAKEWGWSPTSLSPDDMYSSLERGIVDGVTGTAKTFISNAWNEVVKYRYMNLNMINQLVTIIMNQDTWNSLPAGVQDIIKEYSSGGSWNVGKFYDDAMRTIEEELEPDLVSDKYKMEAVTLSDEVVAEFQAAADRAADQWAAGLDKQGQPGTKLLARTRELIKEHAE